MQQSALLKVIRRIGSQSELARRLKIPVQQINHWLSRGSRIPFHHAITIQAFTHGEVNCYELAPYARANHRREDCLVVHRCLLHHLEDFTRQCCPPITISQRVRQAFCVEKAAGIRWGGHRRGQQDQIFGFDGGQTLQRSLVKSLGFGNSETYRQAKLVVEKGSLALIAAMDKQLVSISLAAKLTKFSPAIQTQLVKYQRKTILSLINQAMDETQLLDYLASFSLSKKQHQNPHAELTSGDITHGQD